MITKDQFITKINSYNLSEELIAKCIAYYDNDSKSINKEAVIDGDDSERLIKTVNKWYGIVNSTKERKPRTKKVVEPSFEIDMTSINQVKETIKKSDSTDEVLAIQSELEDLVVYCVERLEKIMQKDIQAKEDKAKQLIEELNKLGKKYKLVEE